VGKGVMTEEADHSSIIGHFVHDVVLTAINSLVIVSRARLLDPFSFSITYLTYGYTYYSPATLISPQPHLKIHRRRITSNFRSEKAGYFDPNLFALDAGHY